MKNIPTKERIAVIGLIAMLVTNPLTGQYLLGAVDWMFQQVFTYGAWVTLAVTVYFFWLIGSYVYQSSKVNTTSKSKKASKFIET